MAPSDISSPAGTAARVLGTRLVAIAVIRAVVVVTLGVFVATAGRALLVDDGAALGVTATVVLLVFSASVPFWPAATHRGVLDVSVVLDAAGVAVLLAVTGGAVSPFTPLAVLVVALHLLAFGTRTGVRIGVAVSLALGWVWSTSTPMPTGTDPGGLLHPDVRMFIVLIATWVAVVSVSVLSRVVEHDLRQAAASVDTIHAVGRAVQPEDGPVGVARQVVSGITHHLAVPSASLWLVDPAAPTTAVLTAWSHDGHLADPVPSTDVEFGDVHDGKGGRAALLRTRGPMARVHPGEAIVVPVVHGAAVQGLLVVSAPPQRWPGGHSHLVRSLEEIGHDVADALADARQLLYLRQQARTDPVTGVPNHRALQERLRSELSRAERRWASGNDAALSLVLFDLDHFKRVNDTHGHPTGDAVLAAVAGAVDRATRGADLLCRYGGEEFAIVLADTSPGEARQAAERFRHVVASVEVEAPNGQAVRVTASFGVASVTGPGTDRSTLVDVADEALYRAKRHGRDRVVALGRPVAAAGVE